ncbi:hypothetical protein AOQ84DRAFT_365873 [Glonium stellatum]|uniref:Uncharacterized protein n=1 Tax=Glonium stellatum TaxID=574774 RepID=A0A8E2EX22_9PEZI|nr:hypothetical protein AOQ84DRAFT_365873 [Glonium stellatum]
MTFIWGWLSDEPLHGRRWPFIYLGAVIMLTFNTLLWQMPLYSNIHGRKVGYRLGQVGFSVGPPILTWINKICSDGTKKRALLVALGKDFAYVVQAMVSPQLFSRRDRGG